MESKYSRKYIIGTGMGLQDVDHLKNSPYFIKESDRYIAGEISLDELDHIITKYYESKPDVENRTDEADKVSIRISSLISEDAFTFTVGQYLAIHEYLFKGIIKSAGKFRTYNFSKEEWVLDGASVSYGDYRELEATLAYDFVQEKNFNYKGLSKNEIIDHLAVFIANLWQIHAFEEGNTRATAVFSIMYLRKLGFDITNDAFEKNAWYFRNALVRANYANLNKGITEDRSYLIFFLKNLLLGEENKLENRSLHIGDYNGDILTKRQLRILDLMKLNPSISLDEVAASLSISLRTTKSVVASLKEAGYLTRINGKKFGKWVVKID